MRSNSIVYRMLSVTALFVGTAFNIVSAGTIHVPGDYPGIQLAVDAALDGDTIIVSPGTYAGGIVVLGKSVHLTASDTTHSAIISGSGVNLVKFTDSEASGSVLEGFKLSGGLIGVLCENSGPTIRRNILDGQQVGYWGAISLGGTGYATTGASPATIVNNTIVNCANGGISTFSTVAPIIKNNIIAFNNHYGIHREGQIPGVAQPALSYNDVYGNPVPYQEISDPGVGTISLDPLIDPVTRGLSQYSSCINAGDPDAAYNDPDGSRNDMGAIPSGLTAALKLDTVRVPTDAVRIAVAISMVKEGGIILVSPGTYIEALDFNAKTFSLVSVSGAAVTTIKTPWSGSTSAPVVIDTINTSGQSGVIDTINSGHTGEDYRSAFGAQVSSAIITISAGSGSGTLIKGFTIDGGGTTQGINCFQSNPTVTNCVIQNCRGSYDGGAMWFQQSGAVITKNIIRNNYAPISGAGLFVRLGYGHGTMLIEGNTFNGNVGGNGPAISLIEGDSAVVTRNVAYNNTAIPSSGRRGGIYIRGANIQVRNNTLVGNTVGLTLLMCDGIDTRNNILTGNLEYGLQYLDDEYPQNVNMTSDYNDVWNNALGNYYMTSAVAHDISADPLLLADYNLADGSPCIDTGDPAPSYNDPDGSRNDIGAKPRECCVWIRGNVDCDAWGLCDIADLITLIEHLFVRRTLLCCSAEANVDRDGQVDIADVTALIDHLYLNHLPLEPCY